VSSPPSFSGFPPEAITFFAGLAEDNSKRYFDAHRSTYEDAIREPLELLLADLHGEFGTGKVFRPNRDVRFSKDKSPYKLAAYAVLVRDDATCTGHYVQLSAEGLRVGGGLYGPDRGQLERARRAIADERFGAELERIVAGLPPLVLMPPELRTAPRGFPRDHPRIDLLRRKHLAAMRLHAPAPWLGTPAALERVAEDWRQLGPLHAWLERNVGAADAVQR
jgi:uncharacterized protein (TIGR02453 family)